MRYVFHTLDVFTRQIFGGNALAVVPDARGLTETWMQAVAREFNLSETAFVWPPENPAHTRRLRILTPAAELPFAGLPRWARPGCWRRSARFPWRNRRPRSASRKGWGR